MVTKKGDDLKILHIVLLCSIVILVIVFAIVYSNIKSNRVEIENKNLTYIEAMDSGEVSNCQHIDDPELRGICEIKLGDCYTDECLVTKARTNMDEGMCFEIQDEALRAQCSSTITFSSILEKSIKQDDISVCDELIYPESIERCQDNFYYGKKMNEGTKEFCDRIVNDEIRNNCFQ